MLPLMSHGVYADGTDRQTDGRMPDSYIMLSAMNAASVKIPECFADQQKFSTRYGKRSARYELMFQIRFLMQIVSNKI